MACETLLETAPLQITSEVCATSSPVFIDDDVIHVKYRSHSGFGCGYARLDRAMKGACVFGVSGPGDIIACAKELLADMKLVAVPVDMVSCSVKKRVHEEKHDVANQDAACTLQ